MKRSLLATTALCAVVICGPAFANCSMMGMTGSGKCPVSPTVANMGTLTYKPSGKSFHSDNSDHALNADNASRAANSDNADNAGYADNAGQLGGKSADWIRGNSTYSSTSGHATSADNATNADSATHATSANSASHADSATYADSSHEAYQTIVIWDGEHQAFCALSRPDASSAFVQWNGACQ